MARFVIQWDGPLYLVLQGPFCYPRSTSDLQAATVLTMSKAYAYQAVVGGEIVQVG